MSPAEKSLLETQHRCIADFEAKLAAANAEIANLRTQLAAQIEAKGPCICGGEAQRDSEEALNKIYYLATRALSEPPDGTGDLVQICTVIEELRAARAKEKP